MGGCTLGGSASHDRNPLVPHPHSLCPFSSHSCALFCTFLHSRKFQLLYFQEIPYSLAKKQGGGGSGGFRNGHASCRAARFWADLSDPHQSRRGPGPKLSFVQEKHLLCALPESFLPSLPYTS